MRISYIFIYLTSIIFLYSCSSSYEKLSKNTQIPNNELNKQLLKSYKAKAIFEAKEMHDWNSAKLYSEKAIKAINGQRVEPNKIEYWKIEESKKSDLLVAYDNLMIIYDEASIQNPYDLAIAVTSLDCWAEQQEENWQTWDIQNCKRDFLNAMHNIYETIKSTNKKNENMNNNDEEKIKFKKNENIKIEEKTEILIKKIIYFDFDKADISDVSLGKIIQFININKDKIEKYLIIGHTDTKGTKKYNDDLSYKRAQAVKDILINLGINKVNIKLLGKGENNLLVKTEDEIAHPANRRAEISGIK